MISVFCAVSLDGFIAGPDDDLAWLDEVEHPEGEDHGYEALMARIDALLMGRRTFEVVRGFGGAWHYTKPVFVLTRTLTEVPEDLAGKVEFVGGSPAEVVARLAAKGHTYLYLDGGQAIQGFLEHDLVDELILTRFPVLLGAGVPLFGTLSRKLDFVHRGTRPLAGGLSQEVYARRRDGNATEGPAAGSGRDR